MKTIRKNSVEILLVGPVTKTDGFTAHQSALLTSASAAVAFVHDTAAGIDISSFTWATASVGGTVIPGYYHLTLASAITSIPGPVTICINNSTDFLPVRAEYQVVGSAPFDAIWGSAPNILTSLDIGLLYESTISSATSLTEFEMTTGFGTNDLWNSLECSLQDVSGGIAWNTRVTDVIAATNKIHIATSAPFTIEDGVDKLRIYASENPTAALNTYDPPTRSSATIDKNSIESKMLSYTRIMCRNDIGVVTDDASALTAVNADSGAGGGTYSAEKHSLMGFVSGSASLNVNVKKFGGVTIIGSGSADSLFRTAGT